MTFTEFHNGSQVCGPASILNGHFTCRTVTAVHSQSSLRCLHTNYSSLVKPWPLLVQQTRTVRKLYPEPFQQDPEYYLPPVEETNLDLHYIPNLGNKGSELVKRVQELNGQDLGRLFAVIHIGGRQRKVTTEDLVLIHGFFAPQIGDKIRIEKVMLVGSKDFTLFGRPLLSRELVNVKATVIEKTLSHVEVDFTMLKRYRRLKFKQHPQSVIVINSIEIDPNNINGQS